MLFIMIIISFFLICLCSDGSNIDMIPILEIGLPIPIIKSALKDKQTVPGLKMTFVNDLQDLRMLKVVFLLKSQIMVNI